MSETNYHDPKVRLRMVEHGIEHELKYAVEHGRKDAAFVNSTCTCPELDGGGDCEACQHTNEFSAWGCELCCNPLAGERYPVALINPGVDIEPLYYSVCVDCMYYIEYGQLDDMSMMEMEGYKNEPNT